MLDFIEILYQKIRPYIFKYKNGFFELPFINNTPQLMWESFKQTPFTKYDPTLNKITAANLFMDAEVYYHEPQEESVIVYSSVFAKRNIVYRQIFLKQNPPKYYCLTCFISEPQANTAKTILHDIRFEGVMWMLLKPGAQIKNYHFKGSHSTTVNFYFTHKWLELYLKKHQQNSTLFLRFLAANQDVITSQHPANKANRAFLQQCKQVMEECSGQERNRQFNNYITEVMNFFATDCLVELSNSNYLNLSNIDRMKVKQAEQLMHNHLCAKFPGLAYIAHEISVSETKLKTLFKMVHNTTVLHYFQQMKMAAAKEMLDTKQHKISEVASAFGYENSSKFSAAFKQHFDCLPSQVVSDAKQKQQFK